MQQSFIEKHGRGQPRALDLLSHAPRAELARFPTVMLLTRRLIWRFMMDWNRVEGNWKQVKGKVKEKWGKLTDDDLNVINGRRDQLEGKLQERYGIAKDQIRKDINDWYDAQTW